MIVTYPEVAVASKEKWRERAAKEAWMTRVVM